MELMNIKTAFSFAKTFYGIDMKESDFEEIALSAWELIGTKHSEIKRFIGDVEEGFLRLPCDCADIESVHIPIEDFNTTNTLTDGFDGTSFATEHYVEAIPSMDSPFYQEGKLVKYKLVGNSLQFDKNFKNVVVVYHGILMDEDDLPLINDKEMRAIAAYVAYAATYKRGLMKNDSNIISMANVIKAEWLKYCNAARISSNITQNEMDAILDAKYSHNRKVYGVSYKPTR